MALTRVHVMRHGEVHNPEGILYGRLPGYRLSERGQSQAQAVADAAALAGARQLGGIYERTPNTIATQMNATTMCFR